MMKSAKIPDDTTVGVPWPCLALRLSNMTQQRASHGPSQRGNFLPLPCDPANKARIRPTGREADGAHRRGPRSVGALGDPGWKRDLPWAPCANSSSSDARLSTIPTGVRHGRSNSSRSPMARLIRPGYDFAQAPTSNTGGSGGASSSTSHDPATERRLERVRARLALKKH